MAKNTRIMRRAALASLALSFSSAMVWANEAAPVPVAPQVAQVAQVAQAATEAVDGQVPRRQAAWEEKIAGRLEDESRFTLSLRREPLSNVMAMLENATAVRFRCGALPDALISIQVEDAPLISTLEPMFQEMGFALRRDGLNLFVFSNRAAGVANGNSSKLVSWSMWRGQEAPPIGWNNVRLATGNTLKGRVSAESLVNGKALSLSWNTPQADKANGAGWEAVGLELDTVRRPGIAITAPRREKDSTSSDKPDGKSAEAPVWMRWPINLREVPPGAQLLLETPCDTTLFVNGAPLLTGRQGSMLVDLGRVLQPGSNCLALYFPRVPADLKGAPLLRYEWFIAGKMNAPVRASLGASTNPNPHVSSPVLERPNNGNRPGDAGSSFAEVVPR